MSDYKKALPYILLITGLICVAFHLTLSLWAVKFVPSLADLALAHLASVGEKAMPYVLDLIGANDPRVKEAGLTLLRAVGEVTDWSKDYPDLLKKVVGDFSTTADPVMKKHLAGVLATSNTTEAVGALQSGAKDPAVHDACVSALGSIAEKAPTPELKRVALHATGIAGSVEARRAVSATADLAGAVARPALDAMQTIMGGDGQKKQAERTAPATGSK